MYIYINFLEKIFDNFTFSSIYLNDTIIVTETKMFVNGQVYVEQNYTTYEGELIDTKHFIYSSNETLLTMLNQLFDNIPIYRRKRQINSENATQLLYNEENDDDQFSKYIVYKILIEFPVSMNKLLFNDSKSPTFDQLKQRLNRTNSTNSK